MFRLLRFLLFVAIVVGALAYLGGYWQPAWLPPSPAVASQPPIEADRARERAGEAGRRLSEEAAKAGKKIEEAVSDGALATKIKSKMALDDYVDATQIRVDAKDGVVTLTGTYGSAREHERAVQLARETNGVTRVEDKMTAR
jgi:hyperosmotically inducible periplasmic protein